jgi:glycosyltransferase involved in cell wall biosynthesis
MDMMKAFIKKGHEVIALGSESEIEWKSKFLEQGIEYRQFYVNRTGLNPIKDIKTYKELKMLIMNYQPDKIFTYQAKTIVYGSLAAKSANVDEVYALIAGLGSVFRGEGLKNKLIKAIMRIQYKLACKACKKVFFQNNDDKSEFISNKILNEEKTEIINGSGVNLEKFTVKPLPEFPSFLYIGRLIKDKGIIEYLETCKIIKKKYPKVRCLLVGPYDSNPSAIKPEELEPYIEQNIIEYFGEQSDVRPFIEQCSIYVLPSYHEGTPKTVIEAMAMGRPILTSDAPGCRETVKDGLNGFLIKIKDVNMLVEKSIFLIENKEKVIEMGKESLRIATKKYDVNLINKKIMDVMNV